MEDLLYILWRDWNFVIVVMGLGLLSIALNRPDPKHVAEIERFAAEQGGRVLGVDRLPWGAGPLEAWRAPLNSVCYAVTVADPNGELRRVYVALHRSNLTVLKSRALKA